MNGGNDLETGIFATAGPAYILGPDGRSIYGQSGGLDRTLLTEAVGATTNSPDSMVRSDARACGSAAKAPSAKMES